MRDFALFKVPHSKVSSKPIKRNVLKRIVAKIITQKSSNQSISFSGGSVKLSEADNINSTDEIPLEDLLKEIVDNPDDERCRMFEYICQCYNHDLNDKTHLIVDVIKMILTVGHPSDFVFTLEQWIRFISLFETFVKYGPGARRMGKKTNCYRRYLNCCGELRHNSNQASGATGTTTTTTTLTQNGSITETTVASQKLDVVPNGSDRKRQSEFKSYENAIKKKYKEDPSFGYQEDYNDIGVYPNVTFSASSKKKRKRYIKLEDRPKPKFQNLSNYQQDKILYSQPLLVTSKYACQIKYRVTYDFEAKQVTLSVYSQEPKASISVGPLESQVCVMQHTHNFNFFDKKNGITPVSKVSEIPSSLRNNILNLIVRDKVKTLQDLQFQLWLIYRSSPPAYLTTPHHRNGMTVAKASSFFYLSINQSSEVAVQQAVKNIMMKNSRVGEHPQAYRRRTDDSGNMIPYKPSWLLSTDDNYLPKLDKFEVPENLVDDGLRLIIGSIRDMKLNKLISNYFPEISVENDTYNLQQGEDEIECKPVVPFWSLLDDSAVMRSGTGDPYKYTLNKKKIDEVFLIFRKPIGYLFPGDESRKGYNVRYVVHRFFEQGVVSHPYYFRYGTVRSGNHVVRRVIRMRAPLHSEVYHHSINHNDFNRLVLLGRPVGMVYMVIGNVVYGDNSELTIDQGNEIIKINSSKNSESSDDCFDDFFSTTA